MSYRGAQRVEFSPRMSREDFLEAKKAGKYKGVQRNYRGSFTAQISDSIAKKSRWLGTFDTPEEAAAAFVNAATKMKEKCSKSCINASIHNLDLNKAPSSNRPKLDLNTEPIDC